jgi:hypothetical protein
LTGRPQESEAARYYFTYINQILGNDVIAAISAQLEEATALCATISEEKSLHRYAPGKWSIRQVLNHVTDTERAFTFRALWFARGFETPLPGFDQDVAATAAEADRLSWTVHIEEFRRVRLSPISLFENMPPEAWLRGGVASDNFVTVRALAWIVAGHLAHHITGLRRHYL